MSEVQYIENNGKPTYAVIPVEDYNRLLASAAGDVEDAEYSAIMAAIKTEEEETFPAEFVRRWPRSYRALINAKASAIDFCVFLASDLAPVDRESCLYCYPKLLLG